MNSINLAWKIRKNAVEMTYRSGASHIGAILSVADIVAVLYTDIMKTFPFDAKNDYRDRLVLSKGHAGVAIYCALAEKGFFDINQLQTYYKDGSVLSGHVSHKDVSGVEFSTGSLGHGINVACGMALAAKYDNKTHRVFTIIGDGECNEGTVWETALFANHHNLSNFTVIIDHNKIQAMGKCEDIMSLNNLQTKWDSFGWNTLEIDGHNHEELKTALIQKNDNNKPTCIIAHTIKGKGISFMENNLLWHYRNPQGDDYTNAIRELEVNKP